MVRADDPVFVGAHHLTRVFVVSLGLPIIAHYFSARAAKRGKDGRPVRPKGDGVED